ncbi:MAG: uracil-DNA glycosylase [Acidobacteriota bacterium]|jgi:uracil-DNA glycosylase
MNDPTDELAEQLTFFSELGVTDLDIRERESQVTESQPAVSLADIREELGECTRCKLHSGRIQIVFGTGDPNADLMFVGEAPGADEDRQGEPFVGKAGQLLTKIIAAIGLSRDQVYIANILKCRPPNNRDPQPDEVASCEPFLFKQIDSIQPMMIVALGKYAAQTLLRSTVPISRLRGRFFSYHGVPLMPTFHPAYLLHNPGGKREVWEDMQKVRDTLKERGSRYYH